MAFTLKQLEAFIWVVDLGSFRRAADRLNTTQPNISARIAALETALGTSLMERDAGSVRLTPKGQQMLDHARQILRASEDMMAASGRASQIDGTLRLGVTELIAHTWLRAFLGRLSADYPNIHVELTVDMSVKLEAELADRTLDIALQNAPFGREIDAAVPLGTYPLVWVAAPVLGLEHGDTWSAADISRHPILTHARDTRLFVETRAHFAQHKELDARLVPSSTLSACIHMTSNAMGVAAIPVAMVQAELERGELVRIDYPWVPAPLEFFARYDAARAPAFVAQAAEIAAGTAAGWATE